MEYFVFGLFFVIFIVLVLFRDLLGGIKKPQQGPWPRLRQKLSTLCQQFSGFIKLHGDVDPLIFHACLGCSGQIQSTSACFDSRLANTITSYWSG